jgi:pyruvate dehydrogenase kinase 2/3/4
MLMFLPLCWLQGVAELKRELNDRAVSAEMPEIHQFLDGFYLSRIGIRILIGES